MTTIIIKSFNRPYYLERCIQSLYQMARGDYEVLILDDGTPEKYLLKITAKFPSIQIKKSNQFQNKNLAIAENIQYGKSIDGFKIPTDLWFDNVKNASEYVLVIEDDVWFTEHIDLNTITKEMDTNKIVLTKLGWLGNHRYDEFCEIAKLSDSLTKVIPKNLFTSNKWVMNLFMYNKFKFFTVLYKLGLVDNFTKRKYWALNSILMGLYHREYWLAIWEDAKNEVDEKQQLRNAAAYYHKHKKIVFARTNKEILKTTFKSSATGSYHEYGNEFDVNRMNYVINEAWYNDEFNSMENYPKDFSDAYIKHFLDKENHPDAQYDDWYQWAEKFRKQYRDLGAEVDN